MLRNISLYIHYPFCAKKCPYCDFNSHVREKFPYEKLFQAYRKQLDYFATELANNPLQAGEKLAIPTIYFGGGTPSLIDPQLLREILQAVRFYFPVSSDCEITMEINPRDVTQEKLSSWMQAGINRFSCGVQSLSDENLRFLGRDHGAKKSKHALSLLAQSGVSFSFDMIYGLPNQKLDQWLEELSQGLEYNSNHLSLYQLTIEKGTEFFAQVKKKEFAMPNEDLLADFYLATIEKMQASGFEQYEISNFAKGKDYLSRHNMQYWLMGEYIGIGAGAHSYLKYKILDKEVGSGLYKRKRLDMLYSPEAWLDAVISNHNHGIKQVLWSSRDEFLREYLMMRLRIKQGITNNEMLEEFGKSIEELFFKTQLNKLTDFLEFKESSKQIESFSVKSSKRVILDSIISALYDCINEKNI